MNHFVLFGPHVYFLSEYLLGFGGSFFAFRGGSRLLRSGLASGLNELASQLLYVIFVGLDLLLSLHQALKGSLVFRRFFRLSPKLLDGLFLRGDFCVFNLLHIITGFNCICLIVY